MKYFSSEYWALIMSRLDCR